MQRPSAEVLLKVFVLLKKIREIYYFFISNFFYQFFQHPFIANAKDPKPILDLLAEFKAEIIEDEIADVNDDTKTEVKFFQKKISGH